MEDVDREISEMKLSLNARARTVAESYLTAVSLGSNHDFILCSSIAVEKFNA
jgi:actin related protein 2/3 complex subunit 4